MRQPFHILTKPIGPICNLRCRYCFYLEKQALYDERNWKMTDAVLERFVESYIASQDTPVVSFAWQGGEPTLMGLYFFERVVELQRRHCPPGRTVENAIQTNGVLIDSDWAAFLARERFLIGVSIDGPRDLHDHYRVDAKGRGSFDRVMAGIEHLKAAGADFNTLTVVNRLNVREPRRVYNFLKGIGARHVQFIPLVERLAGSIRENRLTGPPNLLPQVGKLAPWCPRAEEWGDFLMEVFNLWVRRDIGQVFVQLFDVQLGIYCGMPATLCVFQETCGWAMAMEHNGDIYACDHFVYPEFYLGNIMEGDLREIAEQDKQRRFGEDKRDALPRLCRECRWLAHCRGECPKHRILVTPDGEPGLNNLCAGYRRFFEHSELYFVRMTELLREQRAPAELMFELARQEAEEDERYRHVRPNEPYPCGSGKKFKRRRRLRP